MRLSGNLLAGLAASGWTAVVGIAATPLYLKYLGADAYGLVGVFTTILALAQLLDFGLSPTVNREVARCSATGQLHAAKNLLRSLEIVYWTVAVLLGGIVAASARWIATNWLHSNNLGANEVTHSITLMGIVIAVRWPVGLYLGTLMGAQRLSVASSIGAINATVAAAVATCAIAFIAPSIEYFFICQSATGALYALAMRAAAWRVLGGAAGATLQLPVLQTIWRFSAMLAIVTITGAALSQFDKVILSRVAPLDDYGRYMLAAMLAGALYLLVTPVFNVVFPRLSALVVAGDENAVSSLYTLATRFLTTFIFSVSAAVVLLAEPLLAVWTRNPTVAQKTAPIVSILVAGSALHGVMYLPYALQMAYGRLNIALWIHGLLLLTWMPAAFLLITAFAEIGAAASWLALHFLYLILGTILTHREIQRSIAIRWLFVDVGLPLATSSLTAALFYWIGLPATMSAGALLLMAGLIVSLSICFTIVFSPQLRTSIVENVQSIRSAY